MVGKIEEQQANLFNHERLLTDILNMDHPLCKLTAAIDWASIEERFAAAYCENNGSPGQPIRRMVGLHYLKYTYDLSDEEVVMRWLENPYYQYFCGEEVFQHELPIDRSTMSKFRKRMEQTHLDGLLAETIKAGLKTGAVKPTSFHRVNTDTTVMEKNIAFPTDARLHYKAIRKIVQAAKEQGVELRQTYTRKAKQAFIQHNRYNHARQFKRARKPLRKLKTYAGRLYRDIRRKAEHAGITLNEKSMELLRLTNRLLSQKRTDKNKIYSLHAPEVVCIAKGKAHKRYEFGCKVSFTTTSKDNFIIGSHALEGNPYDGHTLEPSLEQSDRILRSINPAYHIKTNYGDQGYRGHGYEGDVEVVIENKANRKRLKKKPWLYKWLRRRSAIEPIIGHAKSDGRLDRNFLKGTQGDKINATLAACGQNLRKILATLAAALLRLVALLAKIPILALLQPSPIKIHPGWPAINGVRHG